MNSVHLNQQVIFLVIGYPGAGKSYFSRQFAELIGAIHISDDRIRYELFNEPRYDSNEDEVIERIRQYMLESLLKTNQPIIIDSNLNKTDRKKLRQELRSTRVPVLTVWVQTDLETSFERASKRDRRQTDDKYETSMDFDTFDGLQKKFKRPDRDEAIVISGKHLFKTQSVSVLRRLIKANLVQIPQTNTATAQSLRPSGRFDPSMRPPLQR